MRCQIAVIFLSLMAASALAGDPPALIPLPQKMECRDGVFPLQPETLILTDAATRDTGQCLAEQLGKATGYSLKAGASTQAQPAKGEILLTTQDAKPELGAEGYELTVAPDSVVVRAGESAGLFYGVQSLLQLLPPEVYAAKPAAGVDWKIPCVRIEDQPRFKWRGLMLDVARHFFTPGEVKPWTTTSPQTMPPNRAPPATICR
ncbi:MAG: beta-N-acetylhexosaminidase [Verrucomicrobiota bacterium]|jgi:hexosaminidase